MELSLERPGDHLFIRSVTREGIQVVDRVFSGSLIVSADRIVENWAVEAPQDLDEESFDPIFALDPEVVLLGTGARQVFPEPRLMMCFHSRGTGIEVMATAAACRTFNVLVSERRRVVAALLAPSAVAGKGVNP
jgi:uncharacterized protein